ncbi:hypothetical protein [Erwinia sp. 9145]|uniref:hypothetical protein n=1 Tax=Erwinia sp. 9145 TaxID=1500895 RepID=UPI000AF1CE48
MTGKGFNIFVEGHGYINTRDGKLNLNDGTAAATVAPGAGHNGDIVSAVEALFDPQQKAQVKKSVQKPAGNAAPVSKPAAIQRVPPVSKKQPLENRLDRRVVKSIMKSEGIHHIQGGIPEAYGFRKGFGPAYEEIMTARGKYGVGSSEEFAVVSKYMNESARKAGALNFSDPGKEAAVMSLAHMCGVGGAQAILNSMVSGDFVKSSKITSENAELLESLNPKDFQEQLKNARITYDNIIYGKTMTSVDGIRMTWSEAYNKGLQIRYEREAAEFMKLTHKK